MQKLRRGFLENPRGNENTCKRLTPHFWFVFRCSADLQNDFCRNVVLSGGTTLTRGLVPRLEHELSRINPKIRSVRAPANRGYSAWIGGSILGSLSSLDNMYATVDEYAEHGVRIINQKCFWRSLWFSYEIVKFSLWLLFMYFLFPFFFSAFDFFFWRNVWTVITSLKHSLVVSPVKNHPRKLSGLLEESMKKSSSSVPILVRDIFVSSWLIAPGSPRKVQLQQMVTRVWGGMASFQWIENNEYFSRVMLKFVC